jgi:hypothetical protein
VSDVVIEKEDINKAITWLFSSCDYTPKPLTSGVLRGIVAHIGSGDPFAFTTAFMRGLPREENIKKDIELAKTIRGCACGFIKTLGEWGEIDNESGAVIHVEETTFLVIGKGFNSKLNEFKKIMIALAEKYNRDAVIVGHRTNAADDKFIMERIGKNNEILAVFNDYKFNSVEGVQKMILENNDYNGLSRMDNKNFILKTSVYTYRPESNFMSGNIRMNIYIKATGVGL